MAKMITITITGIKCDTEGCDYRNDDVNSTNYLDWVNKTCPKCDSILLTQDDYDAVLAMEELEASLDLDIPDDILDLGGESKFDVDMNGSGTIQLIEREGE